MTFNEKIDRLTKTSNRSKLSRLAGLHSTAITEYVHKQYVPRADAMLRISRVLGVSFEWLADDLRGFPPVWIDGADRPILERVA
jgi:transcriptional regulator with XRE-family HTH domain